MLKKDSNRLFQTIAREGFDPKLFTLEYVDTEKSGFYDQIVLKGSPLCFSIAVGSTYDLYDYEFTLFAPNFPISKSRGERAMGWCDLDRLEEALIEWLKNHVRPYLSELLEPNLWQQMQLETPLVTGEVPSSEDIAYFTNEEKQQLKMSVSEFRLLVLKEFNPSTPELEIIDGRLNYITGAVDRLNRIDWRSIAISAVLAISLALTLDTESGRLLYDLFIKAFSSVVGLLPQ